MILTVMKAIYVIGYIKACKKSGILTCDPAIPVRRSNQLSYEATDVGSWSFLGPNEPVRNECEVVI